MFSQSYAPLGYQQITSLAASTALTVPPGANVALIDCEAQAVRWRDDGTAPTAAIGMTMAVADAPLLFSAKQTAGAKLNVAFYRLAG